MYVKTMLFLIGLSIAICLSGCSEEEGDISAPFEYEGLSMYGTEGKFGIVKVNGESSAPPFPVGEGRHYEVYFLDESADYTGKTYTMTATHKETEETIYLYEAGIGNYKSGAKFVLGREGLWRIDVSVDEEPLTSFVVEVK